MQGGRAERRNPAHGRHHMVADLTKVADPTAHSKRLEELIYGTSTAEAQSTSTPKAERANEATGANRRGWRARHARQDADGRKRGREGSRGAALSLGARHIVGRIGSLVGTLGALVLVASHAARQANQPQPTPRRLPPSASELQPHSFARVGIQPRRPLTSYISRRPGAPGFSPPSSLSPLPLEKMRSWRG